MDITTFFKQDEAKEKNRKIERIYEKSKVQYVSVLSDCVANSIIDLLEYSFMMDFMKYGGSFVRFKKFNTIYDRITNNISNFEEFKNACIILFGHIYLLFDVESKTINMKPIYDIYEFTNDQKIGLEKIMNFLYDDNLKTFGFYGFAGTGKTTTIIKLMNYLLSQKYLKSIVFAAPTNQAVNIMKAKFKNDTKSMLNSNENLNSQLDKLEDSGYRISFTTIHKLLGFKNDFNAEGNKIFVKSKKSNLETYDCIIIDECSMISFDIIAHIFNDIRNTDRKTPKILFIGDPAQLPPVSEKVSVIFAKDAKDFQKGVQSPSVLADNFVLFKKVFEFDESNTNANALFQEFQNNIINQNSFTLEQVVRSNDVNVIGLSNEVRKLVMGTIKTPNFNKFKSSKIRLFKHDNKSKLDSKWFKICIEYFKNQDTSISNIILTWTNRQTDEYNNALRQILFKKTILNQFEIGDILVFNEFYNMKESQNVEIASDRFYACEQIRIIAIEEVLKSISEFDESLPQELKKMESFVALEDKYKKTIKAMNKISTRKYNAWKLFVRKISDSQNLYQIYVLKDSSKNILDKDKDETSIKILELRKVLSCLFKEKIETIDRTVIRPLWREWNNKFVDTFASVSLGQSITSHKSQSSTCYNVFIDAHDILLNNNENESLRCLYTAITRTSNDLFILL